MKRNYREAMRAAARERDERQDDEAVEARDWHEEWARTAQPARQEEQNTNQRSKE